MPIQLNRRAMLRFMDQAPPESHGHHTALGGLFGEPLAVALLLHFFRQQGSQATCLSMKVTQGTKRGKRLDAWILVETNGTAKLYQTEIKVWAARAIGGSSLSLEATEAERIAHGKERWQRLWVGGTLEGDNVAKVLIPMRNPAGYEHLPPEPLLCLWWTLSPDGQLGPYWTLPIDTPSFTQLHVFSLSSYLRSLTDETLTLDLPLLEQRLTLLDGLFTTVPAEN